MSVLCLSTRLPRKTLGHHQHIVETTRSQVYITLRSHPPTLFGTLFSVTQGWPVEPGYIPAKCPHPPRYSPPTAPAHTDRKCFQWHSWLFNICVSSVCECLQNNYDKTPHTEKTQLGGLVSSSSCSNTVRDFSGLFFDPGLLFSLLVRSQRETNLLCISRI